MTIDSHTHLGGFPAVDAIKDELRTRSDVASWRSRFPEIYDEIRQTSPSDNADDLIDAMDQHEVAISIVQPTVGVANDDLLNMARKYPHRLVPLAWVAPFRWDGRWDGDTPNATSNRAPDDVARLASEALNSLGFAGIGETCARAVTQQVDPVLIARDFEPLMDVLGEKGYPIQFPTGWTQFPGNLYYQDPLWIDEIAGRHPDVPIVLTKMGRGLQRFFDAALAVALRNKNVYLDIVATTPDHLKVAIEVLGAERIMYGTDWTYTWRHLASPYDAHTASMMTLLEATQDEGARKAVLEETAARVFERGVASAQERSVGPRDPAVSI